jgi:hypothetical protein
MEQDSNAPYGPEEFAKSYTSEQANIEVEHTRSWPTKIMAFYIAINFGLAASLTTAKKYFTTLSSGCVFKIVLTVLAGVLAVWVIIVLRKNHLNYLTYRNVQVHLQRKYLQNWQDEFNLPDEWFNKIKVTWYTRCIGWILYAYIVVIVTGSVIVGFWLIL